MIRNGFFLPFYLTFSQRLAKAFLHALQRALSQPFSGMLLLRQHKQLEGLTIWSDDGVSCPSQLASVASSGFAPRHPPLTTDRRFPCVVLRNSIVTRLLNEALFDVLASHHVVTNLGAHHQVRDHTTSHFGGHRWLVRWEHLPAQALKGSLRTVLCICLQIECIEQIHMCSV